MKFKFKTLSLLLAGAAMGMTGCQSEEPFVNGGEDNGAYSGKTFFVTAGLALPSSAGSRSGTDGGKEGNQGETNSDATPDDFEYGYDFENDVRTMILMFTDKNDKFIAYSKVSGIEKAPTGSANYQFNVLAEVKYDDLQKAYEGEGSFLSASNNEVNVYAYCNYTANLENLFKDLASGSTEWKDWAGEVTEGSSAAGSSPTITNTIWAERSFLMTNYSKTTTKFPDDLQKWDDYADKSFPFYVTNPANDQGNPNTPETRPALTPIYVERSAARIDFRDGSPTNNQTYTITTKVHIQNTENGQTTVEESEHNFFNIKLTRMSLVNMSKNFYYLRRVSANGLNAGSTLLGIEGATNFVVDTDADAKNSNSISTAASSPNNTTEHFNFCLYTSDEEDPNGTAYNRDGWYTDKITDVLQGKYYDTWNGKNGGTYKIWRYVTENTIPGEKNQKTVQSTGVVFKGKIQAGEDIANTYNTKDAVASQERYISEKVQEALETAETLKAEQIDQLPVLYSFDGFLYAGWEELIEKAAEDGKGGRLYTRVENILKDYKLDGSEYTTTGSGNDVLTMEIAYLIVTMPSSEDLTALETSNPDLFNKYKSVEGKSIAMTDDAMVAQAPKQEITVFKASDEKDGDGVGYYCYYFYWNRHNDNGKSGLMGPMEFATVRNNVYKLAVTKINQFGHPRVKKYDPDPEEEERDDEEPTRYIEVQVEVLPWVVRVNDIEF
ncbi:MAG: Mfa1 fimbrilin C-terminal domain-containing protein [Paramuribaculum sp.]|nr:Mfa1 fimbrilin C-terminal domain-containing protein [Paramuribaculum sp.]